MSRYALLIERNRSTFRNEIFATCAVVGEASEHYGIGRMFANEVDLLTALQAARIADIAVNTAIGAVKGGFNSFAYITYDEAQGLGLLGWVPIRSNF
jgi:hypothetical protein